MRSCAVRLCLAAIVCAIACAARARADDVAAYLEQHGLTQLLAVHLESQVDSTTGEQRETLLRRLADLYAQLLERESDPATRVALEERSRLLLEQAPARSADELRLALLRASYRTAEKIAENHRMRLARPEEVETATRTFAEIAPQLQALSQQMRETVATLERRLSRASGTEAVALSESVDRARNQLSQSAFLAAWSLYYDDWLRNDRKATKARIAESLFAELMMGTENTAPNPEDVSVDLRSTEAMARSILGMALCKSLTSSSATAIAWVLLLTAPDAYEPLRAQSPVWQMAIHLEHHEYRETLDVLDEVRATTQELPLAWLRLCAVYALEETRRDRFADQLVQYAVTELAARGELQQVLDLATRYGVAALGDAGFALKYVQGVIQYQDARKRHAGEDPTIDSAIGAMYKQAADALRVAITEPDAAKYPLAAAACKRLIAWCSYFQSNFLDASRDFQAAASALSGGDASDALWMAIVSLDKVAETGRSAEVQLSLDGLVDRYIAMYPSDPNTAKLLLKRSMRTKEPSPEAVAELLSIPPGNDAYHSAQARACDMLYQLFRAARGNDRLVYAGQFLSAAVPLISQPANAAPAGEGAFERLIIRCRQVLEVSLDDGVDRAGAARAAFDALDNAAATNPAAIAVYRDEIDSRRVQERLLAGDATDAAKIANEIWDRDSTSIWSRLAVRAMFRHAHRVWRDAGASVAEQTSALDRVAQFGGRVLHEFKDDPNALERPGAIGYYAAVAEATMTQWERDRDRSLAEKSLFLYEALLARRPSNAAFLRAAALLSDACDQPQKALDNWRKIVAGTNVGSDAWYEAKFHQIQLLSKLDPARARAVINQHKQLNPDFGPEPWGAKIKGLDELIPANPANATALTNDADDADAPSDEPMEENENSESDASDRIIVIDAIDNPSRVAGSCVISVVPRCRGRCA